MIFAGVSTLQPSGSYKWVAPLVVGMHPEMRAEMMQEYHQEMQNMKEAAASPSHKQTTHTVYKLKVLRPHPTQDRKVLEYWGTGTKSEVREIKREREQEYGEEYEFEIVEA